MNVATAPLLLALVLGSAVSAAAQSTSVPRRLRVDLAGGVIASFQPASPDVPQIFEGGVGGTVPGWAVEGVLGQPDGFIVAVGLSTTSDFSRARGGRAVGPATLSVTHRDTLVSFLVGMRKRIPSGFFELKGGPGLVYDSTTFLSRPDSNVSDRLCFTAAITYSVQLSGRTSIDSSLAYSRVSRSQTFATYGLGTSIFRPGIAVRLRLF
jgi:hypothetical protein